MSLITLFVAARSALAKQRERRRAYHELMALDDRSLSDIGLHRSQLPALVEGVGPAVHVEGEPDAVVASAFGVFPQLAGGRPWMPPI
jgi:uncharacterized protein YjiS (DUF1127 family)